jgi:hypothetical protein
MKKVLLLNDDIELPFERNEKDFLAAGFCNCTDSIYHLSVMCIVVPVTQYSSWLQSHRMAFCWLKPLNQVQGNLALLLQLVFEL